MNTSTINSQMLNASTGKYQDITTGVEFISINQYNCASIVYRQYFSNSLPNDLTTGGSIESVAGFNVMVGGTVVNGYTSDGTNSFSISVSSNNLVLSQAGTLAGDCNGWVEYTKV